MNLYLICTVLCNAKDKLIKIIKLYVSVIKNIITLKGNKNFIDLNLLCARVWESIQCVIPNSGIQVLKTCITGECENPGSVFLDRNFLYLQ